MTGPGAPPLATLDDLAGKDIYVSRATSYYESLLTLNQRFSQRGLKPMRLREAPGNFETEDVLEMANAGLVNIVVADGYIARLWRQVYPNIRVREDLVVHQNGDIAFAIRKDSPQLKAALDAFTRTHGQGTEFGNVTLQKYLGQTRWVLNATSEQELRKFSTLVGLFQKYGRQYDIDWLLMAAQGYQESQLDQGRHSAAGAIGVMQVMPATGDKLQVGDITQLEPNIHAGVKYIRFIVDQYYKNEPMDALNRVLFAFASYNAGPARIRSLRTEAHSLGLDPNVWFDNVERVAAYRIGRETVQYVANIYKYYIAYTLVQDKVEAEPAEAALTPIHCGQRFADPAFEALPRAAPNLLSATRHRISNMMVAPTRAVLPVWSYGGATSTTSPPMRFRPRNPRSRRCASSVVMPPISGVPVPGAYTGSSPSTSNEI